MWLPDKWMLEPPPERELPRFTRLRWQARHQERSGGRGNQAELSEASIKRNRELLWGLGLSRIWEVFKSKMPLETDSWLFDRRVHFSLAT